MKQTTFIRWFSDVTLADLHLVGGKNASLGELIQNLSPLGMNIPNGFAVTTEAYRYFISQNHLSSLIEKKLDSLPADDLNTLSKISQEVRQCIIGSPFPDTLNEVIREAYATLMADKKESAVAVRSSATTEDLPNASFAGQQESFLNIAGIETVLNAIKHVFASLFNERAITYRIHQKISCKDMAISAGIQHMVRSDLATSGVIFTIDTESGFDKVVLITGTYGLGEAIVQGIVTPDEFYVYKPNLAQQKNGILKRRLGNKTHKFIYQDAAITDGLEKIVQLPVDIAEQSQFCLTDAEISYLANQAVLIENHYKRPMDIEWAKDGIDGKFYIVQARPETVNAQLSTASIEHYHLHKTSNLKPLVNGFSVGQKISHGAACILHDSTHLADFPSGSILVTDITDPDWEPIMKKAAGIVTNRGGRTCHAAIIARELGIPAVVGCVDATSKITDNQLLTVSCGEGEIGFVYAEKVPFSIQKIDVQKITPPPVELMLNAGNPERAFLLQKLPNAGIGLARIEFIISSMIGIHPKAALNYSTLKTSLKKAIAQKIMGYTNPVEFYVKKLQEGIGTLGAAFYPKPVIVRFSDFKSNEYSNLLGGSVYEPHEENPMIGFRGAARYISPLFEDCFALECEALKFVREQMGLTNIKVMIPFIRTVEEAKAIIEVMNKFGLKRGENGLEIIFMCEIPSNALLADDFLDYCDGFSIGSNDLTQLTLGIDRDSELVAPQFNEENPAVKSLLHQAIDACRRKNKYIGICGQAPSDHPNLAKWLVDENVSSLSLNADSIVETWMMLTEP